MLHCSQSGPPYGTGHTLHVGPDHLLRHVHAQPVLLVLGRKASDVTKVAWLLQCVATEHLWHKNPDWK